MNFRVLRLWESLKIWRYQYGFIRWFMDRATSHLASRETLPGVIQNKRFYWKEDRTRYLSARKNESSLREVRAQVTVASRWLSCAVFFGGSYCWARKTLPFFSWSRKVIALPIWQCKVHLFLWGSVTELTIVVIDGWGNWQWVVEPASFLYRASGSQF